MSILFRYILGSVSKVFVMSLSALATIYLVVDFFENIRRFIKHDAGGLDVLLYFLCKIPYIVFQLAPVAVLMATLLTLGLLLKNNEITALRGCGLSLYRIALPFVSFSVFVALGLLVLSAVIVPRATLRAEFIKEVQIKKKNPTRTFTDARTWIQAAADTLMNIDIVESGGEVLRGVTLYRFGPQFELVEVTEARAIHYTANGWELDHGTAWRLFPNGRFLADEFESKRVTLAQLPEDFDSWLSVGSDQMTLGNLRAYADRLRRNGYNFSRFLTDYYGRWAFPFVSVIMAIVGIALSLKGMGTRGGGMTIGIGQALGVSFLYWTTHSVGIALGRGGVLLPAFAGWCANLIFLSFAFYLLLRVRF